MIRTRIQKLSLPFTLKRETFGGSTKATAPFCESALVVSANIRPLTVVATGPFLLEVPNSTHFPFQTSHRSWRSSEGVAGRGNMLALEGLLTVMESVTVAPALPKASSNASHSVSLNLGFSPNG